MCLLVKVYHPTHNLAQMDDSSLTKPLDLAPNVQETLGTEAHLSLHVQPRTPRPWETLQVKWPGFFNKSGIKKRKGWRDKIYRS